MRRALTAAGLALLVLGCSGALSGKYLTSPGSGYGFEFDGDTVYSLTGDTIGRGTYSVDGSTVRVCFGGLCADRLMVNDCIIDRDGPDYCKT